MGRGLLDVGLHFFRCAETDFFDAVLFGQGLELAALVAHAGEAFHPVVGQDQFQGPLAGVVGLLGIRVDLHALVDGIDASRHEALGALDLGKAHSAGADGVDLFEITKRRDPEPGQTRSFQNGGAGRTFDLQAVNFYFNSTH
jgi:hypothetical protein